MRSNAAVTSVLRMIKRLQKHGPGTAAGAVVVAAEEQWNHSKSSNAPNVKGELKGFPLCLLRAAPASYHNFLLVLQARVLCLVPSVLQVLAAEDDHRVIADTQLKQSQLHCIALSA